MPYIVAVYRHPTRESAEHAVAMCSPAHGCESADVEVVDALPVVLSGLVKGGEYATIDEWENQASDEEIICIAANGRVLHGYATASEAKAALPITWYHYTE